MRTLHQRTPRKRLGLRLGHEDEVGIGLLFVVSIKYSAFPLNIMKAVILILLLASAAFAAPVYYTGYEKELKYSTRSTLGSTTRLALGSNNTTIGSLIVTGKQGSLMPIAKTYNTRKPVISAPSTFNPNRNVIHSNVTMQTWDYQGYCIEQPKTVQLRATKISCSYQRQDRQWNTWSCETPGYLRCVGTSCPKNTCRTNGIRVS